MVLSSDQTPNQEAQERKRQFETGGYGHEKANQLCVQYGHRVCGVKVCRREYILHRLYRRGERGGPKYVRTVGAGLFDLQ